MHGITNEMLADKPKFADVVEDFLAFVNGAELIIHNAPFDTGFLNHELRLVGGKVAVGRVEAVCTVLDTLELARSCIPARRTTSIRCAGATASTTRNAPCTAHCSTPKSWPTSTWP